MKNLSELLAEARGIPIEFRGLEVRALYEVSVATKSNITVSFLRVNPDRPQAARFEADGAALAVNGVELKEAVFWSDTAPKEFIVSVTPSRSVGKLKLWNEWRDDAGVQHAWIGNAGMVVVTSATGDVVLKCSDGFGRPTFDDLVVHLRTNADGES